MPQVQRTCNTDKKHLFTSTAQRDSVTLEKKVKGRCTLLVAVVQHAARCITLLNAACCSPKNFFR
jgi:hypothetical protein